MDVSVILCTRNRAAILPAALDSVVAASQAEHDIRLEIIVVDNGSSDNTQESFAGWKSCVGVNAKVLYEPRPGVSCAKNTGIKSSRGEVLVFVDDDCRLSIGYFSDLVRHYSGDTGPVVRGGRVELGDPSDLPFTIKTENKVSRLGGLIHPSGFVHGANLTMASRVIELIGSFDERFGPGAPFLAAEDTDLVYRAHKAGIPVEYVPDMTVFHYHGRRDLNEIKRLKFAYEYGNGALLAKNLVSGKVLDRHFYWNLRNSVFELFGGKKFDVALQLSHRTIVAGNLAGAWRYLSYALFKR
ncbi:glycosyltransferase [Mesorhizobium sp. BAC0120]|uniref:glycosyltransferase family 2 protein n=1 Tax=Mesorhizobium sp. BAC0120 TaxID=3090670 RepID=UPI00298BFF66|nr:glycosyltransferase [Mesorhizobium sp. BAC0120]MDW6023931.1 glycosyltransferase [Mesorhizobium sp. BAC0120]